MPAESARRLFDQTPGVAGSARSAATVRISQLRAGLLELVLRARSSRSMRRAVSTSAGLFCRTSSRASALPRPAEAPVIKMTGRGGALPRRHPSPSAQSPTSGSRSVSSRSSEASQSASVSSASRRRSGSPTRDQGVLNPELIADARDDEIDQVAKLSGPVIPAGHGRKDDRPGPRDPHHVLEMDQAQWRFARDQDQLAPLLQMDVGRPGDQVGRGARRRWRPGCSCCME